MRLGCIWSLSPSKYFVFGCCESPAAPFATQDSQFLTLLSSFAHRSLQTRDLTGGASAFAGSTATSYGGHASSGSVAVASSLLGAPASAVALGSATSYGGLAKSLASAQAFGHWRSLEEVSGKTMRGAYYRLLSCFSHQTFSHRPRAMPLRKPTANCCMTKRAENCCMRRRSES